MYLIKNIGVSIKSKNNPIENPINFLRSIRISLSRQNLKINYNRTNIVNRYCTICNNTFDPDEYTFIFERITDNI